MRRFLLAGLLALPLMAYVQQTASANGGCCGCINFGTDITIKKWFRPGCGCGPCDCCNSCCGGGGCGGGGTCNCAPWYLYWPMEAHFQTPAPTGYPYWPGPMGALPGNGGFAGPTAWPGYPTAPMPAGNCGAPGSYAQYPGYAPAPSYAQYPGYAPAPSYAQYPGYAPAPMQQAPTFQPVGYTPPQAPSYWYGR